MQINQLKQLAIFEVKPVARVSGRTEYNLRIFPITALVSIALAFGTTIFQSLKSARVNPARVFQYE